MRGSSTRNTPYADLVYKRLQRDGFLRRDVQRMVNQGRNVFGACMVAHGRRRRHGDRHHPPLPRMLRRRASA